MSMLGRQHDVGMGVNMLIKNENPPLFPAAVRHCR